MEQESWSDELAISNYHDIKELLEVALVHAAAASTPREAKGFLIEIQQHFKGLMLRREDREELYERLQEAFREVNAKLDAERTGFEQEAAGNYHDIRPLVNEAAVRALGSNDLRATWDYLLGIQQRMKEAKLLREQRDELYRDLQDAFEEVKRRRSEAHRTFETEAQRNYLRLKPLVDQALAQAEETHEYKETREFLRKIQSEFKGIRMVHEQQEELYSRLQTAFGILDRRVDDFFRNKKKNWAVKMQFTLSRLSADIFELQQSLEKDEEERKELEDQFDILTSSGKSRESVAGLEARIASARINMARKQKQILDLETERTALTARLDEPDTSTR